MSASHAPRMLTLSAGAAAAVLAVGTVFAGTATARPSADTRDLCDGAPVACSIQAPSTWRAGATQQVAVTGNPGVRLVVHGVRVRPGVRGAGHRFVPEVKAFTVTTNADGYGHADVAVGTGADGGDLLFVPTDATAADLTEVLGAWTTVLGRTPVMTGDGFGDHKPVGTALHLDLVAAAPGARYGVEMKSSGAWSSVALGAGEPCPDDGQCRLRYEIPRGLAAKKHEFRLVHLDSGSPVGAWTAVPDRDGTQRAPTLLERPDDVGEAVDGSLAADVSDVPVTAERLANLQVPEVGADLAFAAPRSAHDVAWVRRAAATSGALALAWALALLLRRRTA